MSFFYQANKDATKKAAPRAGSRGVVPIATLRDMGCSACPRDKQADKIHSPKLKPSGVKDPTVYILGLSPSEEDDDANDHWRDKAGEAIYEAFGKKFMDTHVRSNYIVQCHGDVDEVVTECCRRRIIEDIERTKPAIIVTVGDLPLRWITGPKDRGQLNALQLRGTTMVARVGNHSAYVMPLIFPNYVHKKAKFGKSEYELAMEFDVDRIKHMAQGGLGELELPQTYTSKDVYTGIELVTDINVLERRLSDMRRHKRLGIDLETTGFRPYRLDNPLMLTCAIGTFEDVIAFPLEHPDGFDTKRKRMLAVGMLGEWLLDSPTKIAHHLGMEMEWFHYYYGPSVLYRTPWEDTMAMAHTLDERKGTKSLEVQTIINFGFNLKAHSKVDAARLLEYPLKDTLLYNGGDSKWTHKLADKLLPVIHSNEADLLEYERKVRLAPSLTLLEARGVPVNLDVADKIGKDLANLIDDIEHKIQRTPEVIKYAKRHGRFEPGNDDQVLKLMRDVLNRPEIHVEERGVTKVTTSEEVLSIMPASEVPSAALILEHRGASKLNGTYIKPVITGAILDRDGLVRAKYGSMVAETGRLNSDDPNMQNWPKRKFKYVRRIMTTDGWVVQIRYDDGTVVTLEEDRCFLACDYGQIEFRVVGMASEDPEIVKACWTGYDVHKFWAERIVKLYPGIKDTIVREFGVDWDEKGIKTLRQEAKNKWVFPQLFGSSVNSCAAQLWLPKDIAEDLAAEFWDTFRAAKKWQEKLLKHYEKNLYVATLSGRLRRGPLTKNQIINHPIQGTAADIVLRGMVELIELGVVTGNNNIIPHMNVHDDLTFLPLVSRLDETLATVSREMCRHHFDFLNVPLMVEASIGTNWADLEEIKKFRSDEIYNLPNPYAKEAA